MHTYSQVYLNDITEEQRDGKGKEGRYERNISISYIPV